MAKATQRRTGQGHRLRIIGGEWRGRRLAFPQQTAVRPTPDRVRETLFNWLQPSLAGARCLDLYAGTGALGLEALSRGAALAWLVEKDQRLVRAAEEHGRALAAGARLKVIRADARRWLEDSRPVPFDLVFLDPPYDVPLAPLLEALRQDWLSASARVYVERDCAAQIDELVGYGALKKRGHAGRVFFALLAPLTASS